jgi:hypothetical protein
MEFHRTSMRRHPKFKEKYIVTNFQGHEITVTGKAEANRVAKASKAVVAARKKRLGK